MTTARRRYIVIILATLLVNLMLFVLFPYYMKSREDNLESDTSGELFQPMNMVRLIPPKAKPKPKPRDEKKPPELKRTLPKRLSKPRKTRMKQPDLQLELPPMQLSAHPALAAGPQIAPPGPAAPENVPDLSFKATYDQAEVDQAPFSISKTRPLYPYRARRLRLDGEVQVRFLVEKNGHVTNIEILGASPPEIFDSSVMAALSSWRFSPGKLRGEAVATWVTTTIVFQMENI